MPGVRGASPAYNRSRPPTGLRIEENLDCASYPEGEVPAMDATIQELRRMTLSSN